eukprot:5844425-Pleurochrysis_carterae.AAC.2
MQSVHFTSMHAPRHPRRAVRTGDGAVAAAGCLAVNLVQTAVMGRCVASTTAGRSTARCSSGRRRRTTTRRSGTWCTTTATRRTSLRRRQRARV